MLKVWISPGRDVPERVAKRAMAEWTKDYGDTPLPGINVGGARHPRACDNCGATVWSTEMYGGRSECASCKPKLGFA